jgi:hypothetical protein
MRVEFYLTTALEVSHFASIVRALRSLGVDAVFVNERTATRNANITGWDHPDTIDALLTRLDLPFVKTCKRDCNVVTTIQPELSVRYYSGVKIRMMYGVGLTKAEKVTMCEPAFDFHFVHGPLTQRIQFSQHALASPDLPPERVKVMGYPRFDEWFEDWSELAQRDLLVGKPGLLWLPTWGSRSSIPYYVDAIFALSERFQIWVKPHHATATGEHGRMAFLKEGPVKMIEFCEEPEASLACASIVLADLSSGALTEALYLKKPVVALAQSEDAKNLFMPIEQAVSVCLLSFTLEQCIDGALYRHKNPSPAVDVIRNELVDSTYGQDGMRAAKLIIECASLPKLSA